MQPSQLMGVIIPHQDVTNMMNSAAEEILIALCEDMGSFALLKTMIARA